MKATAKVTPAYTVGVLPDPFVARTFVDPAWAPRKREMLGRTRAGDGHGAVVTGDELEPVPATIILGISQQYHLGSGEASRPLR